MRKWLNRWITRKALKHLGKEKVVYNSTLHTRFREDGVKTRGRFDIMLCVILVIHSLYDRSLGIKNINIDEDKECIRVSISLNKITRLMLLKDGIESELGRVLGKKVSVQMQYVNKLYGLDFYDVI